MIATLGNFATKLLTGSQTGITRVRGTPQVHDDRRAHRLRLPAPPSGRGPAHAVAGRDAARGLRDAARAARRAAPGGLERRARGRGRRGRGAAEPPDDQLDLFGLTASVELASDSRRDGGDRRRAGRPSSRPGDVVLVGGELGRRQDDADPRRLPGARRRRAGRLAHLHDRAAATGGRGPGLPPGPLPARAPRGARIPACSTTT